MHPAHDALGRKSVEVAMDRHAADPELSRKFIELGRTGAQHVIEQDPTPLGWFERPFGVGFLRCVRQGGTQPLSYT